MSRYLTNIRFGNFEFKTKTMMTSLRNLVIQLNNILVIWKKFQLERRGNWSKKLNNIQNSIYEHTFRTVFSSGIVVGRFTALNNLKN